MALLDEDPGYGSRTMGGRPAPLSLYPPPPDPPPPPRIVDRVAYLTFAQALEKQRQEAEQQRLQQEAFARAAAPFAEVRSAYAQAKRIAGVAQQYETHPELRPPENPSPSYLADQATLASGNAPKPFGRYLTPAEEVQMGYRKPKLDPVLDYIAEKDAQAGQFLGQATRPVTSRVPGGDIAQGFVDEALRPSSLVAMLAPVAGEGALAARLLKNAATQGGANVVLDLLLGRTDPKQLALSFGVGAATGAALPEITTAIGEIRAAAQTPGGQARIAAARKQLASETGGGTPLDPLGAGARAEGVVEEGLSLPSSVSATPPSPVPAKRYIDPPEVPKLSSQFPDEAVPDRPALAQATAKSQTAGGATRTLGNAVAERVDEIVTSRADATASPATNLLRWFSSEATRFRNSPLNEGVTQYKRAVAAGDAWAMETGNQMGRNAKDAFGKDANAVYIAADGQPVFAKASDGTNIKLLNRDVLENAHIPEIAARMTPKQRQVAADAAGLLQKLRAEARASGARIGAARAVDGSEVASYVQRSAIEKDGTRFLEYGDPARPGMKLDTENARDYVTAAEGVRDGVRYADSWSEEYVTHLRALRRHEANASLKQWTDGLSETLKERIVRLDPAAANAKGKANDALKVAYRKLSLRQREIAARMRKEAETAVRQARRRVSIAQRQLNRATAAPELDKTRLRVPDAMKIGKVREELAAATRAGDTRGIRVAQRRLAGLTTQQALQTEVVPRDVLIQRVGKAREALAASVRDLRASAEQSIDVLYRRMDEADRNALLAARADVEAAKGARTLAGKSYNAASAKALKGLGRDLFEAPGGRQVPITAGRFFEAEDAKVIQELAKEFIDRGKSTHPLISLMRLGTQPLNFVTLTMDNSLFGVQGWLTAITRPDKWLRTLVTSPLVAASPRFRARWLLAHEEGVKFVQKYAPQAFDSNPDFAARGSLTADIAGKIKPISYTNQLFQDSRTMLAVHLAESFMKGTKNEQEAFDIGSAIVKMVGVSRTVGSEKDVLLAASFLRSKIGLGLDAIANGGVQGDIARKTFLRLFGGAALATVGYQMYVKGERDPKKLLDSVTPGKDDAFEIEGINLLGTFATEVNLIGDLITDPSQAGDNLGFFGQGKLSILLGNLLAGVQGEDILGRPTSFQKEFLTPGGYAPLSWQQAQEWELRGAPREIAIPAAIFGLKYNPPTAYENLADALKSQGIEPDVFFGEAGTRSQAIADFPELRPLYEKWEQSRRIGTTDQRNAQKIVDASRAKIEAKIKEIVNREAAPTDLKEFTQVESDQRRITREALFPDREGQDARLDPLYDFYDQATNPETGELDFDQLLQLQESYLSQHEELRPIWEQQQYVPYTDNPVEALLKDGQRTVNTTYATNSGFERSYYGSSDIAWKKVQAEWPVAQEYATADDFATHIRQQAEDQGTDPDDRLGGNAVWDDYSERLSAIRVGLLSQHPEVGANLRVWYGVNLPDTKLSDETANEIRRLAEELIKQIVAQ